MWMALRGFPPRAAWGFLLPAVTVGRKRSAEAVWTWRQAAGAWPVVRFPRWAFVRQRPGRASEWGASLARS